MLVGEEEFGWCWKGGKEWNVEFGEIEVEVKVEWRLNVEVEVRSDHG